jgi:hypothetical protein
LTDCPAAEEGAAAALLPPVVGDPIAVWLILKSKGTLKAVLDWF